MRVFDRSFSTRQRIGEQRSFDAWVRLWIVRDVLFRTSSRQSIKRADVLTAPLEVRIINLQRDYDLRTDIYGEPVRMFETRQIVSADSTALEDLQVLVYHPIEYSFDSSQDILSKLAAADLQQVISGAVESSHDLFLEIAVIRSLDADTSRYLPQTFVHFDVAPLLRFNSKAFLGPGERELPGAWLLPGIGDPIAA